MRKSNMLVTILMPLEKEAEILDTVKNALTQLKSQGKIEKATISVHEIDFPLELEI